MILRETMSLCARCKRRLPATVEAHEGRVLLRKTCPEHGAQEALVSSDLEWYQRAMRWAPRLEPPEATRPVTLGCPLDCGPCTAHEQRVHLPVVPITSACNLDCPICYTHNRNEGAWHMDREELRAILGHIRRTTDRQIINITGGEPTQHPQFVELLELCREEGIHRVTVSTHGLRFIKEEWLLEKLAELEARVVLSFDSFEDEANQALLGGKFTKGKMRVLELLEKHALDTTLLPVLARGYNDHELARFVDLALSRDFIRSVEFHPMTFTGQSGRDFDREARYTTYDALSDLERLSEGRLHIDDFVSSPAAHPLCYVVAYLLRLEDGRWLPFTRFMEPEDLRALLGKGLYLEPGPEVDDRLQDVITRLWAGDTECEEADAVLRVLQSLLREMSDSGYDLRAAERVTKAIYVHTHMDEETWDEERIRQCCVGMPTPEGGNMPSCAYNVIYRPRDPRFVEVPEPELVQIEKPAGFSIRRW